MIALVLAAALAGSAPGSCVQPLMTTAGPAGPVRAQKLGELPDALAIRAVLRTVGACPYQDVIRFDVSKPGPSYPVGTLAPVGGGIEEPVTPTAGR